MVLVTPCMTGIHREYLCGVQQPMGIESVFYAHLHFHIDWRKLVDHQVPLFNAHTVFPCQATAYFHTKLEYVSAKCFALFQIPNENAKSKTKQK